MTTTLSPCVRHCCCCDGGSRASRGLAHAGKKRTVARHRDVGNNASSETSEEADLHSSRVYPVLAAVVIRGTSCFPYLDRTDVSRTRFPLGSVTKQIRTPYLFHRAIRNSLNRSADDNKKASLFNYKFGESSLCKIKRKSIGESEHI